MSTLNHLFDLPEQICYVQCGFCTTILLVSVPCSSLSMVVTVRCGHCTSLLSVNMMKASFVPLQLLASLGHDDEQPKGVVSEEVGAPRKTSDRRSPSLLSSSDNGEEDIVRVNTTVNKPPEKRQRAPSAYNRFIKEEIRRLKAQNPNIPHKEAFSTAAKNASFRTPQKNQQEDKPILSCIYIGPSFLPCTSTTKEKVVTRKRERRHGTQMLLRLTYKAMISVKEKQQGVQFGPSHPLSEVKNH
ncbi:hypothetical protein GQ457_18G022050 [Hibiscus cannabinus]